ncbi:Amino acid--[acyl-carrier-protein] ligase 1 [Burkholderiaceae bacterium]|nr:Amino acid--[acyl-carrier-protein] ligase 1 [Burkholderiaceae bacterium]
MTPHSLFDVKDGLATLRPDAMGIVRMLERRIAAWAGEIGARELSYPPLQRVEDLSRIDYFLNFPHLGTLVAPIRKDELEASYGKPGVFRSVCCAHLGDAQYALPSAACYSVYFDFENQRLAGPVHVTTIARCFRNEVEYPDLSRLWGFQMRELVCLGRSAEVQAHLKNFRAKIKAFTERLDLPVEVAIATDPFFDRSSSRAAMQQLFPVKEEFVYGGKVAIASINFHRNFFGERCRITTADGEPAFTGCVAFGIERWIHVLNDRFEGDIERIQAALESALP